MSNQISNPFAAMFGGNVFLYNTGPAGQGGGLNQYLEGPYSPYGILSCWYWTWVKPAVGENRTILKMNPASGFSGGQVKVYFRRNTNEANPRLYVRVDAATGGAFVVFKTAPLPYADSKYHNIILTWNVAASPNTLACYHDGIPIVSVVDSRGGAATFTVAYKHNQDFYIATDGKLRGTVDQEAPFAGALSEIFFDPMQGGLASGGIGAGGDTLVYSFYDAVKGKYCCRPGQIGSDGSTVLKRKPAIYLHGYLNSFTVNHGGNSSFRAHGSISSPGPNTGDPFWSRWWRSGLRFWEGGASTYEYEEPTATSSNAVRASLFNVPTVLEATAAEVKPAIADSPTGLVSFWYKGNTSRLPNSKIISAVVPELGATGPWANAEWAGGVTVWTYNGGLEVILSNQISAGEAAAAYVEFYSIPPLPNDAKWHHVILAWDSRTPACEVYVDGGAFQMEIWPEWQLSPFNFDSTCATIPYSTASYAWRVGGVISGSSDIQPTTAYLGHLSEVYINVADHDFIAALTPSLIAKFKHDTGGAREIGVTATFPFGADGPRPDFYLSGGPAEFPHSFAKTDGSMGHRWGADGADADRAFTMRVIGGPLVAPASDPFRQNELVS